MPGLSNATGSFRRPDGTPAVFAVQRRVIRGRTPGTTTVRRRCRRARSAATRAGRVTLGFRSRCRFGTFPCRTLLTPRDRRVVWPLRRLAVASFGRCAVWPLRRWPLRRLAAAPFGRCAVWPLRRLAAASLAVASFGRCVVWPLRRLAVAPFGRCVVWPLRRLAVAPFGSSAVRQFGSSAVRQFALFLFDYGRTALPACVAVTSFFAGVGSSQFTIALKTMLNSPWFCQR